LSDKRLRNLERQWLAGDRSRELGEAYALELERQDEWDKAHQVRSRIVYLPPDYRERRGFRPPDGRFEIEEIESWDGGRAYQVVDYAYANTIGGFSSREAREVLRFAKEYVERHGDIDFNSFPYDLDDELVYDDWEFQVQWWDNEHPEIQ